MRVTRRVISQTAIYQIKIETWPRRGNTEQYFIHEKEI